MKRHYRLKSQSSIMNTQIVICVALSILLVVQAYPYEQGKRYIPLENRDLQPAASGHGHYGRVQIKVYRGPTTHGGPDQFAPHGFWVKQPADDGYY